MRRITKPIIAAVLAAVMCAALAGCEDDDVPESRLSSGSSAESSDRNSSVSSTESDSSSTVPESPKPEGIALTVSDEIKNAIFTSGLIQMYNDVFQQGGYVTLADLVEKLGDSYTISNVYGEYEEIKDRPIKPNLKESGYLDTKSGEYELNLSPKFTVNGMPDFDGDIQITLCNPSDKDIPLSETLVSQIQPRSGSMAPTIFPTGISGNNVFNDYKNGKFVYGALLPEDLSGFLTEQGFEFVKGSFYKDPMITNKQYYGKFWEAGVGYKLYLRGDTPNAFGAYPFYQYGFYATGYVSQRIAYIKE